MMKTGRRLFKRRMNFSRHWSPFAVLKRARLGAQRASADRFLADFSKAVGKPFFEKVVVDALWDNPNYWARYALLRKAWGLAGGRETGYLGLSGTGERLKTLRRVGINDIIRFEDIRGDRASHRAEAERLLSETNKPGDVLGWKMPNGFPADVLYDGLMKRQKSAYVTLEDPSLVEYVTEALDHCEAAETLQCVGTSATM